MNEIFDVVIKGGLWFDGLGSPSALRHIGVRDGRVAAVSGTPLSEVGAKVIDAAGKWVVPGFLDVHTHYDAEVLVAPGLPESVRHGVTTVVLGSCSLSTIHSDARDCADIFSRVEAVPREHVLSALQSRKTWSDAEGYVRYIDSLPLGPNVAALLGHSDLRTSIMGLGRATDPAVRPDSGEIARMRAGLEAGLDAGLLGLSTMNNRWDKLDGERYRSRPLPSTFSSPRELRNLYGVLRKRSRILQSAPDASRLTSVLSYFAASLGAFVRKPLKISLLTAADSKAMPFLAWVITSVTGLWNRITGADLRWQHVPVPFEVYADGIDLVVFEELGAGTAALHLREQVERNQLFQNEGYRRQFRRELDQRMSPRVWNRDFHEVHIVGCPDLSIVGMSVGQVADARGVHPADAFLDLVVQHGTQLRWRTVIANHRTSVLDKLAIHPTIQMGFADSGAHLRNMAFYSFSLRFLKRVRDAELRGAPFLTAERAVHRLTGELAQWFGLDAGTLRVGDRADIAIVDPNRLGASLEEYHEAPMPEFGGLSRMVNRSDGAVLATLVGGTVLFEGDEFAEGYGTTLRAGRFLRAQERAAGGAEVQ